MENREQKNRAFLFEKNWLEEEDFLSRVERNWRQPVRARNSLEIVQIKLKSVKNNLKGWGKISGGEIRRENTNYAWS
jgi:hypothetical protein